jgi:2-polyprenyl-3-methyl-5-hydroxy-6-metoxy-1,4-benzoquinol methylase
LIESDFSLIDLITGYQGAAVATAALRVGVFDGLSETPVSAQDLAAELQADESNLEALLDALVAIGLAHRVESGYVTTPFVTERISGAGDLASVVEKEAFFARAWLDLDRVVMTGEPAMTSWRDRLSDDPETAQSFLVALDVLARISGPPLEDLPELAPGRRVLDVGGALGTYAKKLAAAGSEVVVVDLAEVVAWAEPGEDVEYVVADVDEDRSAGVEPESFDAALVSHMLHDRSEKDCQALLQQVRQAIRPGGHIVVNDFAGDSGPGAFGPLFDVMMRVETGGAAHKLSRLVTLLEEAEFSEIRRLEFDEPLTVLIGVRTA